MQIKFAVFLFFALFFAPAHIGLPGWGSDGFRWAHDEARARRFGGMRSFGFRGSRGLIRRPAPIRRSFSRRSAFGRSYRRPAYRPIRRPFGSFGGGFFGGFGGILLGGMLGSMFFGRGFGMGGGFGLLEILLVVGGIFLLMRFFRRRAEPAYGGAYSNSGQTDSDRVAEDPYGVGGYADTLGRGEGEENPLYRGPDIGPRKGVRSPTHSRPDPRSRTDPEADLGLIASSDPSFNPDVFVDEARKNFHRFQEAWASRDLEPVRELMDGDIFDVCMRDLDALRRKRRINKIENVQVHEVVPIEIWQEEGFDFIALRYRASLLDYVIDEVSSEILEGSTTDLDNFVEYWTWTRRSGGGQWFLSAMEQS